MIWEGWIIVLISVSTSIIVEIISWFAVYRTENYQSLRNRAEKLTKEFERFQADPTLAQRKSEAKRKQHVESNLQEVHRKLLFRTLLTNVLLGVVTFVIYRIIRSKFSGIVVAKLPFQPIGIIRGMTHRGLEGNDYTECSFVFIYSLLSMSFRQTLKKFLDNVPPKNPVSFANRMQERAEKDM
eukprot:TRINITY_DN3426_c0_g1_i1.p1 TRINITY_DN3426_c0_g1~~TRINITY_DN3426_c0_g1_i1.p1  ORF type:complete len:183 (+),score=37.45 TRINITY_DN3426_c0_g1_i1:37-585(+)